VEEPKSYILRIKWDSHDGHLKGFRTSPEFQTFLGAVGPFIGSMEEMRHYEITHAMDKEKTATLQQKTDGRLTTKRSMINGHNILRLRLKIGYPEFV
jgi:hypothetical protein